MLREAQISLPGDLGERWMFRFGVLQHRALPTNSHIKEWKLIFRNGKLWLCLVVEIQRPVPVNQSIAAGLDIGWRRIPVGIRFGTLYEPMTKTFCELTVDLQKSLGGHNERVPFHINLGPSRWERRNITQLLPDWKPGDAVPSALESRSALQFQRDKLKDAAKCQLREYLGERLPSWFSKAGRRGLLSLEIEFNDDATACHILKMWRQKDEQLGKLVSMYFDRTTKRIEY
jgi:hypothetical protein